MPRALRLGICSFQGKEPAAPAPPSSTVFPPHFRSQLWANWLNSLNSKAPPLNSSFSRLEELVLKKKKKSNDYWRSPSGISDLKPVPGSSCQNIVTPWLLVDQECFIKENTWWELSPKSSQCVDVSQQMAYKAA